MSTPDSSPKRIQPGDTARFTFDSEQCSGIALSVTPEFLVVDSAYGEINVPWMDYLGFTPENYSAPAVGPSLPPVQPVQPIQQVQPVQVIQQITPPSESDAESKRAGIDSILIQSGFDPGIEYIRANYGEHWNKRDIQQIPVEIPVIQPDLSPLIEGFRLAVAELTQAHAAQLSGLESAITRLAEKNTRTDEIQTALIAALTEARKPVEINLKLEMPEQRAKRFVAEKDGDGRMTLSEIPSTEAKIH
ncbi:hypothetical protein [Propionivibrio sp.]|uniref:hypothetical protein n=1 Tax=Propionivibrio sp. TaxID=2212460 RepID=UPI003BF0D7BB